MQELEQIAEVADARFDLKLSIFNFKLPLFGHQLSKQRFGQRIPMSGIIETHQGVADHITAITTDAHAAFRNTTCSIFTRHRVVTAAR